MSIIIFLLVIAVLIFVHELGHFLAAKYFGARVDEFAIGFPPKVLSYKYGETLYTLNLIPFGGFVKIFGENPDDKEVNGKDAARAFVNLKRKTQALILFAGVFFNMLFAWLLLSLAVAFGIPAPFNYQSIEPLTDRKIIVTGVLPDSPAEKAGLRAGEIIVFAERGDRGLQDFDADTLREFIGKEEGSINFLVRNKDEQRSVSVSPKEGIAEGKLAIGVGLGEIGTLQSSWYIAPIEGGKLTFYVLYSTAVGLGVFIYEAVRGAADFAQVAGPIGIVGLVGEASSVGFAYLLAFTAFISVNLAILNLLPFPALDGGRLLFVGIEAVTRRALNRKITGILNIAGFVFLVLLMVLVTYNDIARILAS